MPKTVLEDERTFENGTELTPEDQAQNAAYFERTGRSVEPIAEEGSPVVPPAEPPKPETPPIESAPADTVVQPTPPLSDDPEADAEASADWQAAQNDGERQGRYARRTAELRKLRKADTESQATITELRRQLETKASQPVPQPLVVKAEPAKPPEPKPETKPKEFSKVRPTRPEFKEFAGNDDPVAAHADALADFTEKLADWKEEKRDFEQAEKQRVADEQRQVQESTARETEHQARVDEKFKAIRETRPDFDSITKPVRYSEPLQRLLVHNVNLLADGLELGYQLAKPENAEILKSLNEYSDLVDAKDDAQVRAVLPVLMRDLAAFRKSLSNGAAPTPVAITPTPEPPKPTPPVVVSPKREEAAPVPVRGRGPVPAVRPEEMDPMDSDARRASRRLAQLAS